MLAAVSCGHTLTACSQNNYLTSPPRQKSLSSPQAEHLLGKLVCVSSTNQIASQGRNCARPTDTTRLPPAHLPNRDSDNSKSWLTTACAIPGSGGRWQPLPGPAGCKPFPVRFFPSP